MADMGLDEKYKYKVVVLSKSFARSSNEPIEHLNKNGIRVDIKHNDAPFDEKSTADLIGDADAAIISAQDKIGDLVYKECRNLKVIVNHAAGFDNISPDEAVKHGIKFYTCPANHVAVAELTWALILACSRNLMIANRAVLSSRWEAVPFKGFEVSGKTLGIIGFGKIGKEVVIRSLGFGCRILVYDPYAFVPEFLLGIKLHKTSLNQLLKEADIISLHVPLTSSTEKMINKETIGLMKKKAIIINTSRGGLIDEDALHLALLNKKIMAAGLDVLVNEPPLSKKLIELDNITVLPHIGAQTYEANIKVSQMAAQVVTEVLND